MTFLRVLFCFLVSAIASTSSDLSSLGLKTIFKWRCSGLEFPHGNGQQEDPGAAGAAVVSE